MFVSLVHQNDLCNICFCYGITRLCIRFRRITLEALKINSTSFGLIMFLSNTFSFYSYIVIYAINCVYFKYYFKIWYVCLCRASGSQVVMDPVMLCKKTRKLRGRMADICKNEPALLKEISKGVQLGTKECQYQFRNRRWNCTTARKSLKKVLMRGKQVIFNNNINKN